MSISYFGVATNPADNSALACVAGGGFQPNLNLVASLAAGDLVVIGAVSRENSATRRSELDAALHLGGQTWNSFGSGNDHSSSTSGNIRMAWCVFNGTWLTGGTDDLAFTMNASTANTANSSWMIAFRSSGGAGTTWAVDVAEQAATYAAPSTPFTVTRTGQSAVAASTVTLAHVSSEDDNSWDTFTGSGWTLPGGNAQFRNTQGSGQSFWLAYKIQTSAGATGDVSQNQATLGGDAGWTEIVTFSETLPSGITPNTGSLTAAGLAPVAITQRTITPLASSLTMQGLAPSANPGSLAPAVGAISFLGLTPALTIQAGPVLNPDPAVLSFVGNVPGLYREKIITPDLPALSGDETPIPPTLLTEWTTKPTAPAPMTLTGLNPLIIAGGALTVSPDVGLAQMLGLAATIQVPAGQEGVTLPSRGEIDLVGLAPTLFGIEPLSVDVGGLSLVGLAPELFSRSAWHDSPRPGARTWHAP